ncbi:MAG TPA: NAD(P)-binding domain-containing protein, partial [Gaiellaceae bacterium]
MSGSTRSGMIGLGNMGARIARRIHGAGLDVTGYDIDAAQAERSGVPTAGSVAELVSAARVVFLSLPDSRVVEAVVYGEDGVLAGCEEGQVVVDLSTSAPSSTVKIHGDLADRGVELVDAGISGGAAAAEQGSLTIMAGGSGQALDAARPFLETFSSRVYH